MVKNEVTGCWQRLLRALGFSSVDRSDYESLPESEDAEEEEETHSSITTM